jgi:hypothetical protein
LEFFSKFFLGQDQSFLRLEFFFYREGVGEKILRPGGEMHPPKSKDEEGPKRCLFGEIWKNTRGLEGL